MQRLKDPILYAWHSSKRLRYWTKLILCPLYCCCCCCYCFAICQSGGDCTGARRRRKREMRNETRSAINHRKRVRHVKSRKRRISVDGGRSWGRKRDMKEQGQSLFFGMLPVEVRLKVYEMVLRTGSGEVELQANAKKRNWDRWDVRAADGSGCDVALLRTCRRIYREAHPVLFSSNTFVFRSFDVFAAFTAVIPTHHLAHIRQLVFTTKLTDRNIREYGHVHSPFYHTQTKHEELIRLLTNIPGSRQLCLRCYCSDQECIDRPGFGDFRMLEWFEEQGRVEGLEMFYEISGVGYMERDAGTVVDDVLFRKWKVLERTAMF